MPLATADKSVLTRLLDDFNGLIHKFIRAFLNALEGRVHGNGRLDPDQVMLAPIVLEHLHAVRRSGHQRFPLLPR